MFDFEKIGSTPQGVDMSMKNLTPQPKKSGFDFESIGSETTKEATSEKKPGVLKSVGSALISSEKGFGESIAQAIAAPFYQKEAEANNAKYMKAGDDMMKLVQKTADPIKRETYANLAKEYYAKAGQGIQDIVGELKTTKQVLGEAAGVALDIASAGTYGATAKAAQSGKLLTSSAKIASTADKIGIGANVIYQRAIAQTPTVFKALSSAGLKQAAGKSVVGGAIGYGYDIANNLQSSAEGLDILKPGYGTLIGVTVPTALYGAKALKEGAKKVVKAGVEFVGDFNDKAVIDYLSKTKRVEQLIRNKVTPEDALKVGQGAVRNLRTVMSKEWQDATTAMTEKFQNKITLVGTGRQKQLMNIVDKFGDDVLNKVDSMGNITKINPASMTIDDSLNLLKNINELYGQRVVRESAEGIPVRSFKDFFKNNVIENFGGKEGDVANLYKNYSAKKGVLDAANDIVNAFKLGKPIQQTTAMNRLTSIFKESKGAYLKAIKDLEEQTGIDITSYITAGEMNKSFSFAQSSGFPTKAGLIDKLFQVLTAPISTGNRFSRALLRATKPAETIIDKATTKVAPKTSLINKAFPQVGKEAPKEVLNTIISKAKSIRPGMNIQSVSNKESEALKRIYLESIANEDFMYRGAKNMIKDGKLNPALVEGRVNDVVQKLEREGIDSASYLNAIKGKSFKDYFAFDKANREIFAKIIPDGSLDKTSTILSKKNVIPFKNSGPLTTKILNKLEGRSEVSRQFISDLTNSGDLKQQERDIIREVLGRQKGDKINVTNFAEDVKNELLPLKRKNLSKSPDSAGGDYPNVGKYENISLHEEVRGNVANYSEHIYESPIKTSAGDTHFNGMSKNYFGHTRIEDMEISAKNGLPLVGDRATLERQGFKPEEVRRVIEVQSDLYQKGNLEKEKLFAGDNMLTGKQLPQGMKDKKLADINKLEQYNNPTAHFRMVREEVAQATKDGKTKLQFPTGETAMKIEGLGEELNQFPNTKLSDLENSIGKEIMDKNNNKFTITRIIGNGQFRAVPFTNKDLVKPILEMNTSELADINKYAELFDISGKMDTNNPIYKFYEKDLGRYLKSKYNARTITDNKGVQWNQIDIKPDMNKPVEAFGKAPIKTLVSGAGIGLAGAATGKGIQTLVSKLPPKKETIINKGYIPQKEQALDKTNIETPPTSFDLDKYATDPTHKKNIEQIYNELESIKSASDINKEISRVSKIQDKKSPLENMGQFIMEIADKYKISARMLLTSMKQDSTYGILSLTKNNPGNIGNNDLGQKVSYNTIEEGIEAVAKYLKKIKK